MKVIYFYSIWDSNSLQKKDEFIEMMNELGNVNYEVYAIEESKDKWLQYGLKTVPGIVVLQEEAVVCFFAGSLNWPAIKQYIADNRDCKLEDYIYAIDSYNVLRSGSCHRYDRWNEQLLCIEGYNTGWSSVSSTNQGASSLEIDLYKKHRVKAIGLIPRKWDFNKDLKDSFPDSIAIDISEDGKEWTFWENVSINDKNEATEKRVEIKPVDCRYIRLRFAVKNLRLEKKFFVQLTGLTFYAQYREGLATEKAEPSIVEINSDDDYLNQIVNKRGISYGEKVTTSFWFMKEKQSLPDRCFYDSQTVIVPMKGTMTIQWDEKERKISNGEWMKIPKGCVCKISNEENEKCCFLEVIENVPSFCAWGLRK